MTLDDGTAELIRGSLEDELAGVGPCVGILMGAALLQEFQSRRWLTLETFGVEGTPLFAASQLAFDRTHPVFLSPELAELDYQVGRPSSGP